MTRVRRLLQLGAGVAATAVVAVPALTAPAAASAPASASTPSAGIADSTLTLLSLGTDGSSAPSTISAGIIDMEASTANSGAAAIDLIAAKTRSGTPIGHVHVTPANSPKTVGGQSVSLPTVAGLTLGTLTAPGLQATAALGTSTSSAGVELAGGPPKISLLGLPLSLGTVAGSALSSVDGKDAVAHKTVDISGLSLPTLADLLSKLGLNLAALPISTLQALAGVVGKTVDSTLTSAGAALGTARTAFDDAVSTSNLTQLQGTLQTAQSSLTSATSALTGALNIPASTLALVPGAPSSLTLTSWLALAPALQSAIDAATPADLAGLTQAYTLAQSAVTAAQTAVDDAISGLQGALNTLKAAVDTVVQDLTDALDQPLARLTGIKVSSVADAGGNPSAEGSATVAGVDVLGVSSTLNQLTASLNHVVQPILNVLNGIKVAGVSISLAVPTVTVAKVTKSLTRNGTVSDAAVSVTPLELSIPAEKVTLPSTPLDGSLASLQGSLGALGSLTGSVRHAHAGLTVATPAVHLGLLRLTDAASFTPGRATTSTSSSTPQSNPSSSNPERSASSPGLAFTGATAALPFTALLLLGAAVLLRRRRSGAGEQSD